MCPDRLGIVVGFMKPDKAQKLIRQLAQNSENVRWSRHALQRMREREIDDIDVMRVLRDGTIDGMIEATNDPGWKCKMVRRIRGSRDVGVVTILIQSSRLLIKTVEWEDMR